MKVVTVADLLDRLTIELAHGEAYLNREIDSSEVSRPGLVLTKYLEYYPNERIQLIGQTEMSYINSKTSAEREAIFRNMCTGKTPAVVIARGLRTPKELIAISDEFEFPVLVTQARSSRALASITNFLEGELAERLSRHGVFVEVFGMGILLIGDSGVGKSETALELVQKGHRLIADDRVELYQIDELSLIGEAPEILHNLLEIRGLGIIDIMHLYGAAAIRRSKRLELIIELVIDDGTTYYDRLGFEPTYERIFDVQIPKVYIPVRLGRNLAAIVEAAAMNHRATEMGFDARESFKRNLDRLIESNRKES